VSQSTTTSSCNVGEYDCRDIQTPLDIDTSRYSDGISTASATTVTAPAFPESHESNDLNNNIRALHMLELSLNAIDQGVTDVHEGDARREDARLGSQVNTSASAPTKIFSVEAKQKWNPSGKIISPPK
jgi:hypothetical protein